MRYLGVDYGLKKIGLSLSEGQIASAYEVVYIKGLKDALSKISQVIKKEEIERVVIGVPEGEMGKVTKKFVQSLNTKYAHESVEIIATDETLSSHNARRLMIELEIPKNKRKEEDAYSAALILQEFLNSLN